jgi:serine/alanine adding enzyme
MIRPLIAPFTVRVHTATSLVERWPALARFAAARGPQSLARDPRWLFVFKDALRHDVYALEAHTPDGQTCGVLPLAHVSSVLFGRFLVSLPYLNSNGVVADSPDVQTALIDRAVELAEELNVRHLELRHETRVDHPALDGSLTSKVQMRLPLPANTETLWKGFDAKVRNQIRKGEKNDFTVEWGGENLLNDFLAVVGHNMRDLGTPSHGRAFFACILETFGQGAEICLVRAGAIPIAAALLLHGPGVSEVPTASSLREYNATCANMLMYRHLLDRAVTRGQAIFDFGRSTLDGPTFKFKKQWGASPTPACWQYALRGGDVGELRPENPRYRRAIRLWQKLPVRLTRILGPEIVRGIP